jgi:hypothetical protein
MARDKAGRFIGGTGIPGRSVGSRNLIQRKFVAALTKDFEENGEGVIRIVRIEKPAEYLRLIASILPKEYLVSETSLGDLTDEEVMEALTALRKARAASDTETPERYDA